MKRLLTIGVCIFFFMTVPFYAVAADANADCDMRQRMSDSWYVQYGSTLDWDGEALYYGIVGNCGIFLMNGPIAEESVIEIAGYCFWHSGSFQLYAFNGEHFFPLKEAYETGLLTAADIENINNLHSQYGSKNPNTGEATEMFTAATAAMLLSAAAICYLKKKETV